jgi:electron transport complex protein RnfC
LTLHLGLPSFPGGIHLPERKSETSQQPISPGPLPGRLAVLLSQGQGAPARPVVNLGQRVLRGQLIAEPDGFVSAALHAPTSGTVEAIGNCPHPAGLGDRAVFIVPDGVDIWIPGADVPAADATVAALSPGEIVGKVRAAGVVGMGGAGMPTHVKLTPPAGKSIDCVVVNGCECEPFLAADHRLMLERPVDVVRGLKLLVRAVGARRGIVAVEADQADAYERLLREVRGVEGLGCRMVAVKYPQGSERQLVKALLDREVPPGGLPFDVGVLVQNVATAVAVAEAVHLNRPVTERVVTVGGPGIERPANLLCRIGVPFGALLESQGRLPGVGLLLAGGPMTGLAQPTANVPVLKTTSGVLVLDVPPPAEEYPCINCGRCAEGCPGRLNPGQLAKLIERGELDDALARRVLDCMECGACTYACPAHRPVTQWIRRAKEEARRRLGPPSAGRSSGEPRR